MNLGTASKLRTNVVKPICTKTRFHLYKQVALLYNQNSNLQTTDDIYIHKHLIKL